MLSNESQMDCDDAHVVPAWGQTPGLRRQSLFDRECIKIGSQKRAPSTPFAFTKLEMASSSVKNGATSVAVIPKEILREPNNDVFCFGATAKEEFVKKAESERRRYSSPNKKRKRTSDSHESFYRTETHYNLPADIYSLAFSVLLIFVAAYCLVKLISTIHHDLALKITAHSHAIIQQISACAGEYTANRCHPSERIPAMQQMCNDWELCMLRDPKLVGRLSAGAETVAEVLNKLVDPLSLKTLIVSVLCMLCVFWMIVSGISGFRSGRKATNIHSSQPVVFNLQQPVMHQPSLVKPDKLRYIE